MSDCALKQLDSNTSETWDFITVLLHFDCRQVLKVESSFFNIRSEMSGRETASSRVFSSVQPPRMAALRTDEASMSVVPGITSGISCICDSQQSGPIYVVWNR